MPFSIERNDLAHMDVDAIVVAANERLQITGGVGWDVAQVAGFDQLQEACDEIGFCPTGSAVATPGFGLPAATVVHAVGPVWRGGDQGEDAVLRATYESALRCCADAGAQSLALPLISAGTYGFPSAISFALAMESIRAFLDHYDVDVKLVLFDRDAVRAAVASFGEIAEYIDDNYVETHHDEFRNTAFLDTDESQIIDFDFQVGAPQDTSPTARVSYSGMPAAPTGAAREAAPPRPQRDEGPRGKRRRGPLSHIGSYIEELRESRRESKAEQQAVTFESGYGSALEEPVGYAEERASASMAPLPLPEQELGSAPSDLSAWLDALDAPFSTTLLALIDERGLTDAQVYKRANMSRQLFSKIRSDENYRPTKKTVLALAIALELDLGETSDLLRRAGFALSNSSKADIIVEYFIVRGKYDIFEINEALYCYDQPLL